MAPPQTFRELLARYQAGERSFAKAELDADSENDLAGVCLDDADLSGSFIIATFRGASLRGVRFCTANVKTCDFTDADLTGADFSGAALCSTTFRGAKLDGLTIAGAYYHSHVFGVGDVPDW